MNVRNFFACLSTVWGKNGPPKQNWNILAVVLDICVKFCTIVDEKYRHTPTNFRFKKLYIFKVTSVLVSKFDHLN